MTGATAGPSDPDGTHGPPAGGGVAPGEAVRPARVLIVGDEWFVAMEIEDIVGRSGLAVAGLAVSADEAVRLAAELRPDLVVMDFRLKGERDGTDAAIEIHRRFGLRCLFVSAFSDERMKERAAAAEPAGWLSKPFSAQQLTQALQAALSGPAH